MDEDQNKDEEFEDGLVSLRASIDQLVAVLPEQARCAFSIYETYTQAGFSDEQAFCVTMAYVSEWV